MAALAGAGFLLFVVSNQRGVGRGLVSEATLTAIEAEIQASLEPLGARIEAFRYCRHDLDESCDCRKPKPGMILSLAREHRLSLSQCWMVGDAPSDVAAGKTAGCRTVLIAPTPELVDTAQPDLVAPSLRDASALIAGRSGL